MVSDPRYDTGEFSEPPDDLSALDFCYPHDTEEVSALDALAGYDKPDDSDDGTGYVYAPDDYGFDDGEPPALQAFSVTNPPGTVTVSAYLDGRIQHIDLSSKVTALTEAHLAEEIVVIAKLATQQAQSAQYSVMLDGMRQQGHDTAGARDFLTRDLRLPTPDEADAARARIFSTRYAGDHD